MATSLSGSIKHTWNFNYQETSTDDVETASSAVNQTGPASTAVTDGNGANQAEQLYSKSGTLADAASSNFDLSGALTDIWGNTISWTELKGLYIENQGTDSILEVTGNLWDAIAGGIASAKLNILPGASYSQTFLTAGGVTVTNTSQDTITLTHASDGSLTLTYKLIAIGNA